MKHALVVLIIVFVVALVVLPLVYISLGKIRSPIDKLTLGNKGPLTGQNYIPETKGQVDPDKVYNPNDAFNFELEKTCNAGGYPLLDKDVTSIFNLKEKKASLTSDFFKFSWNLSGEFDKTKPYGSKSVPTGILFGGGTTPETRLVISLWAGKFNAPECVEYYKEKFPKYHDGGRFLKDTNWEKQGFNLIEKGLTRINGYQYYWYMFEDIRKRGELLDTDEANRSLLLEDKLSNQTFTIIYEVYNNGIKYRISFTGDKKQNKSYRSIMQAANGYLGTLMLR
ncbi:MAG: hypothetical protein FGM57_01280 [Candidatus Taylorbacteria bacterium]|nr:hypothetical protein [Candidatus Taylorbacteria bacterium]